MPGTTAANSSKKKSEVELVTERVSKTKKEIEQLKAQLQKLIDDGISKNDFVETKQNLTSVSNEHKTDSHCESVHNFIGNVIKVESEIDINKANTFKDNVSELIAPQLPAVRSNVILRRQDKSPLKQVTNEESPKKTKHYDQEAAREYIKKQKEKRRKLLKNKIKEVGFTQDIKKQRLEELRQKSLQLVSKNIQHQRDRSKSKSQDALDQHEAKQTESGGSQVAQIPNTCKAQVNIENIAIETDLVQPKSELSMNFAHSRFKNITVRSNIRDLSAIPKLDISKHIQFDTDGVSIASSAHTLLTRQSRSTIPTPRHNLEQPNYPFKSTQSTDVTSPVQSVIEKEQTTLIKSLKFTQSTQPSTLEKHKAAIKIQTAFRGYRQRMLYKAALKMKQKLKEQATKEVQTTKIISDIPAWLQAPATVPYPYNFLSTVKRKLNLVAQQPAMMSDVAIQNSLNEQKDPPSDAKTEKSSRQKSSNIKNTDLKSFLSHKCLDLDVKTIQPLALTRHSSLHSKKVSVHNTIPNPDLKFDSNGLASDSDTSKNIPEISSESSVAVTNKQHSAKRAHSDADDYDKPTINTDKIKKLKLLQPKRLNFSSDSIKSHESCKQSSNLSKEISEHITGTNSSTRRKTNSLSNFNSVGQTDASRKDSIIASNKCNYSRHKTIQKATEINNLELIQHKKLERSIKTTESLIPTQLTLSSSKNYVHGVNSEKSTEGNAIKSQVSSKQHLETPVENSRNKETSSKALSEMLDINNPHSERSESIIKTNSSLEKPREYSSNFTSVLSTVSSSIPSLKRPNLSLKSSHRIPNLKNVDNVDDGKAVTTLILKPGETAAVESRVKSNEIHLKFEAELHLLNEFNDSLRQIMAMDKSLMELRNNNIQNDKSTTTYQTRDTQTSFVAKSSTDTNIPTESPQDVSEIHSQVDSKNQIQVPTINYSRGSEVSEQMDIFDLNNTIVETNSASFVTTGLELSELKDHMLTSSNEESNVDISVIFAKENLYNKNVCTGLSLEMFEQLIKDEDARIENLKTILKIREKALVDRTKGELAWLEIQKKHLRDSGQLQEISAIKKKQRGLLIKLEHERHEMQRLKQMQKAASKERKSVLREQRNMIKTQLSNTSNIITKIKRNTKEERRQSGPLKVYNIKSHSESIRSETSMSRKSSIAEEIISVVSHSQSVISHVTEEAIIPNEEVQQQNTEMAPISSNSQVKTEHVKRSLLMREAALQKRRKAAEELLQWHQRLIEEEEKIAELEFAASAIINQVPTITNSMVSDEPTTDKHKFKGSQLNLLWYNMTGREEKKFSDHMNYTMSKISLERFCKDAKKHTISRNKSFNSKRSGKTSDSDSSLSAIDVTVTELTQNTTNEKCKKLKSKSSQSSSEIASQIVISKSKSNDSHQDYTSDFESIPSTDKESELNTGSTDDEQKIWDEGIFPQNDGSQNNSSKMSIIGESQSDKESETISEKLQSIINLSAPSETNKGKIADEKLLVNEQSSVAVIDDNSTSTNKFNYYKNKIGDSIDESIKNTLTTNDINDVSISVDKIIQLETNQDATSKDVSSEIEHDEMQSEILELILVNENTDDISNSLISRGTEIKSYNSLNNVRSEHTISINNEVLYLTSKSDDIEEDIVVSQNDQLLSTLCENQEQDTLNDGQLADTSENELNNEVNENISKTNEAEFVFKPDGNGSNSHENQLNTEINEITSQSKGNDELITKSSETFFKSNQDNIINTPDGDLSCSIAKLSTTAEVSELSYNNSVKSSNNKESDNRILIIDKPSRLKIDESEIKLTESDDTEIISDEEWNQLSDVDKNQESNKIHKNLDFDNLPETSENSFGRKENSMRTITSISKKVESPLLLSYGFVEQQDIENQTELENSCLDEDYAQEIIEDISQKASPQNSVNSTTIVDKEQYTRQQTPDDDTEKLSEDYQDDEKLKDNVNIFNEQLKDKSNINTSADQLEDKTNINISNDQLEAKFNINTSNDDLEDKSNINTFNDQLEDKSNINTSNDQLEDKSNMNTFNDQLEDNSNVNTSNDQHEDKSNMNTFNDPVEDKFNVNTSHDQLEDKSNTNTSDNQSDDKTNINTSDNQFEDKSDDNLNQTYKVPLEEETKQKVVDVKENNKETDTQHDEKKVTADLEYIDVKKRVSEILADVNIPSPRGDKSPRLQDLYVTTYDVVSPENSSSSGSPTEDIEQTFMPTHHIYGSDEVEELLKKQLEIEQEIKEIQQQQQQKEHIPYLYIREIPNKPPPPYTPPVIIQTPVSGSILPTTENQIKTIAKSAADVLHKAYLNNDLQNASLSAGDQKMLQSKSSVDKNCSKFVFDLCKEAAIDHYKQFEPETGPSWMHLTKRSKLGMGKPLDRNGLENFVSMKVRQWLGYEIVKSAENIKRKWSGRKRDHVDELLVVECQVEEKEWTNYDRDELIVKDELTKDIMNMLLSETTQVFNNIFNKKTFLY